MRFIYYFVLFLCINTGLLFAINYLIDPLQIFRKQTYFKPLFTEEQRLQVPGLIKSYSQTADVALIGSSMTSNFRYDQIKNILNKKLIKLSIDGSTPYEQLHAIKMLLAREDTQLKNVIWGLDILSFNSNFGEFSRPMDQYPFYLYGDTYTDTMRYTLNANTLVHSLQTFTSNVIPVKFFRRSFNINDLNTWKRRTGCHVVFEHYKSAVGRNDWMKKIDSKYNNKELEQYLIEIKKMAKQYPNVTFDLFYPPYSIVRYKFLEKNNRLNATTILRDQFGKGVIDINNINLHDVAINSSVISNLNYYKDIGHYDHRVNKEILMSIKNKGYVKNLSVLKKNTRYLKKLISQYDVNVEEQICNSKRLKKTN